MNLGETIIVMLVAAILLTMAFVGGTAMMNSANLTVVQNDMRSFEAAAQQMLMEHFELQTAANADGAEALYNKYLPTDMQITGGKSAKTDAWKNAYNVSFSADARSGGNEFYIMVASGGKNGNYTSTKLDSDDCGIIIRLMDGEVKSETFGFSTSPYDRTDKNITEIKLGAA